ncbi:hypothetical protein GCM10023196_047830 [Actinoallomurus vinaceus]|uniref:Uncharacterized protein n=1 Tax=Actinoallomurus vinaceus TaxID=1080074 RepID=A0ABP8UE88_9ACTN
MAGPDAFEPDVPQAVSRPPTAKAATATGRRLLVGFIGLLLGSRVHGEGACGFGTADMAGACSVPWL